MTTTGPWLSIVWSLPTLCCLLSATRAFQQQLDPPHVGPHSAPPRPHIAAGYASSNIFWPGDTDANGTVYQCAYIPTLVLANHTRLIAHGSCGTEANSCNGLHLQQSSKAAAALESLDERGLPHGTPGNPIQEGKICQKHSDDGGATWSKLRVVARGVDTGKIVWDDLRKVLVMHYSTVPKSVACPDCPGGGAVFEYKSTDLGDTWSEPRCLTVSQNGVVHGGAPIKGCGAPIPGAPTGDGGGSIWASAGAALQLSPSNKFHPHRLVFTGHVNGCQQFWYSDDGENYHFAKNSTGAPLCTIGIGEVGFAETPEGGIFGSGRNGIFHGPGKCNCRGTVRSTDGGDTFGPLGFDPVLVEPECMATMINGGEPGAMFHANPGHGTPKESKSPPDGRASGTVRRSVDGGKSWEASVVLNGHNAYSYSCLSKVPQPGYIGLAFETVLPGSGVPAKWSANNVVFTLIPQNFTNSSA